MYKHYSRTTTSIYLIFLTITSPLLLCMDHTIVNVPPALIPNLIIHHIPFSHDDICSLALVNQEYNKAIYDTTKTRMNKLTKYALTQKTPVANKNITWHKYGSAYACATEESAKDTLTFTLVYLADNAIPKKTSYTSWTKIYPCPSDSNHRPRFRSNKEVYVHGFKFYPEGGLSGATLELMEYSLSTQCLPHVSQCLFDIQDQSEQPLNFTMLLEFPALLNAFLQSTHVRELLISSHDCSTSIDKTKIFALTGVIIPHDYDLFKEYRYLKTTSKSFDDLPHTVKRAITKHYKNQPYKK